MPTMTDRHAVFAVTETLRKVRITEPDAWGRTIDTWTLCDDARRDGDIRYVGSEPIRYYAVRSMDDPEWNDAPRVTLNKVAADSVKLTPKQATALAALAHALPRPGMTIRPGYEAHRWLAITGGALHSTDMHIIVKPLAARGLVEITGVAYGPKTYKLTDLGRAVAATL